MPTEGFPYLDDTNADLRLVGGIPLIQPFAANISSQRGMMLSNHAEQAQILKGNEFPRVFSGFESQIGEYESSTCTREEDVMVLRVIPKFECQQGAHPLLYCQTQTVICQGCDTGQISCFDVNLDTMRSDGYGYTNKPLEQKYISQGMLIPKEMKLTTSPAHHGNMYNLGTNGKIVYMSHPLVTEDAWVVSDEFAAKMDVEEFGTTVINIAKDQIPLNKYGGVDEEYKIHPDVGETVAEDGVICVLRRPTADSFIYDTAKENLSTIQPLHDNPFYAEPGATVVDVDVHINRRAKVKASETMFEQCEKYRAQLSNYYQKIWECYLEIIRTHSEPNLSPHFNSVIAKAISELQIDGKKIRNFSYKSSVTPVCKKETVEFIRIKLTWKVIRKAQKGSKIAGRSGNKGVISAVWPKEDMPVDEYGNVADMIGSPIAGFNRMNPSQWYEQFINFGAEIIRSRIINMMNSGEHTVDEAFNLMISYIADISPKYAELIVASHSSVAKKKELIEEVMDDCMYINVVPFQKGINEQLIEKLREKYDIRKTRVSFNHTRSDGTKIRVTSKDPMMIGYEYWYLLYKVPHMRCPGVGFVNQFGTPVKPSSGAKVQYPFARVPIRMGEDEIRNLTMVAGPETSTRVLGEYANNTDAVNCLTKHLLTDPEPGKLKSIEMPLSEIIEGNKMVNVQKHIIGAFGVDLTPKEEGK